VFPGGQRASSDELAVALTILAGLGALVAIRRGVKGLPGVELAGSTLSAVEFTGYLFVVGGTLRVLTTRFPDSAFARAVNFIY
jgi:hypothetical protein